MLLDWSPYGGDERQFCSPGFDLPFGAFSRSPADAFPEYHSSDDDLSVVTPEALSDSYRTLLAIIDVFERNETYVNTSPYGEPQLGRRGLYRSVGGGTSQETAYLWLLSLSDGSMSLVDIALRSGIPFDDVADAADRLAEKGLLEVQGADERPVVRPRPVSLADRAIRRVGPDDVRRPDRPIGLPPRRRERTEH